MMAYCKPEYQTVEKVGNYTNFNIDGIAVTSERKQSPHSPYTCNFKYPLNLKHSTYIAAEPINFEDNVSEQPPQTLETPVIDFNDEPVAEKELPEELDIGVPIKKELISDFLGYCPPEEQCLNVQRTCLHCIPRFGKGVDEQCKLPLSLPGSSTQDKKPVTKKSLESTEELEEPPCLPKIVCQEQSESVCSWSDYDRDLIYLTEQNSPCESQICERSTLLQMEHQACLNIKQLKKMNRNILCNLLQPVKNTRTCPEPKMKPKSKPKLCYGLKSSQKLPWPCNKISSEIEVNADLIEWLQERRIKVEKELKEKADFTEEEKELVEKEKEIAQKIIEFDKLAEESVKLWELNGSYSSLLSREMVTPMGVVKCGLLELQTGTGKLFRVRRIRSELMINDVMLRKFPLPVPKLELTRNCSLPEISQLDYITDAPRLEDLKKPLVPKQDTEKVGFDFTFWFLPLPLNFEIADFSKDARSFTYHQKLNLLRKIAEHQNEIMKVETEEEEKRHERPVHVPVRQQEDQRRVQEKAKIVLLESKPTPSLVKLFRSILYPQKKKIERPLFQPHKPVKHGSKKPWITVHKSCICVREAFSPWRRLQYLPIESVAKELTLIDKEMLLEVKEIELLNILKHNFTKQENAPNAFRIVAFFDRIVNLITSEILREEELEGRLEIIIKCIDIIQALLAFNNYHSSRAILFAIQSLPICGMSRLMKTFKEKHPEDFRLYMTYSHELLDPRHSCYICTLENFDLHPPFITYFGEILYYNLGHFASMDEKYEGLTVRRIPNYLEYMAKRIKKSKPKAIPKYQKIFKYYKLKLEKSKEASAKKPETREPKWVKGEQVRGVHFSLPTCQGRGNVPVRNWESVLLARSVPFNADQLLPYCKEAASQYNLVSNVKVRQYLLQSNYNLPYDNMKAALNWEKKDVKKSFEAANKLKT